MQGVHNGGGRRPSSLQEECRQPAGLEGCGGSRRRGRIAAERCGEALSCPDRFETLVPLYLICNPVPADLEIRPNGIFFSRRIMKVGKLPKAAEAVDAREAFPRPSPPGRQLLPPRQQIANLPGQRLGMQSMRMPLFDPDSLEDIVHVLEIVVKSEAAVELVG